MPVGVCWVLGPVKVRHQTLSGTLNSQVSVRVVAIGGWGRLAPSVLQDFSI
jgi:hypothetical protein